MAESRKEDAASKLVQEIAQKGEEVPERYIIKNDVISPDINASSNLWEETMLIDFSLLSSDSSSAHKELAKLHSALKDWGCFQVVNHGMTSLFLDELLEVSRQFFALPLEEKLKCSTAEDFFNGYGNAAVIAGDKSLNWNDRLVLTVYPEDQRKLQVWPQKPQKFREILHQFSLSLRMMLEVILKAMARSLELKEDSFLNDHGERGSIDTRFGIYPRCSRLIKFMVFIHIQIDQLLQYFYQIKMYQRAYISRKMISGSRFQSSLELFLLILVTMQRL